MIKGFEYINRDHKGKPSILYIRFLEGDEKKVLCQDFINQSEGSFTSKELNDLFDVEINKHPDIKTQDEKKKLKLYLRDKLIAKKKIEEGTKKFQKLIYKIQKFAEDIYSEV